MRDAAPSTVGEHRSARYQRFLRALVVGSIAATVPVAIGCSDDATPMSDAGPAMDAGPADAGRSTDAGPIVAVDGPLPPPDLPRRA